MWSIFKFSKILFVVFHAWAEIWSFTRLYGCQSSWMQVSHLIQRENAYLSSSHRHLIYIHSPWSTILYTIPQKLTYLPAIRSLIIWAVCLAFYKMKSIIFPKRGVDKVTYPMWLQVHYTLPENTSNNCVRVELRRHIGDYHCDDVVEGKKVAHTKKKVLALRVTRGQKSLDPELVDQGKILRIQRLSFILAAHR